MNNFERYEKQILFAPVKLKGQKKLAKSRIGILGAGALGTNIANILGRAGIGNLIIADSDRVELSNLQRQMLFVEKDVGRSKALAVAHHLGEINSEINVEAFFQEVDKSNFYEIFANCDLIMDATDNFPSRFMLNRMCHKFAIPWVFSGVTASYGQSALFIPHKTACLTCMTSEDLPDEDFPAVNNSGILASIVTAIASFSTASAIRYIVERYSDNQVKFLDVWNQNFRKIQLVKSNFCPVCRPEKLRRK